MSISSFILGVLSAGVGAGIMAIVRDIIKRKWDKDDKKEDKEDAIKRIEKKLDSFIESEKEREDRQEKVTSQLIEKVEKNTKATRLALLERLRYLGICYLNSSDNKIDVDDKELYLNMHEAYEDIGGNGDLDTIVHEVKKREVKTRKTFNQEV